MRSEQSREYQLKEKHTRQGDLFSGHRNMQRGGAFNPVPNITMGLIFSKIMMGLQKLIVAIKYQFFRLTAGLFENWRIPWFKIGLAALAVFIVAKKDIQFSIDMKSPLGAAVSDNEEEQRVRTSGDQWGIAQTLNWKGEGAATLGVPAVDELDEQRVKSYIRRFSKVAASEMEKFGIPASVKMAQGILESQAGDHIACRKANNHFGKLLGGRSFDSAWENWRYHSLLIKNEYPGLLDNGSSYKRWAKALKRSGFNNDPQYDDKLIEVIEKYQLYLLDEG